MEPDPSLPVVKPRPKLVRRPAPIPPDQKPLTRQQSRVSEYILATGCTNTEAANALKLHRTTVQRIVHLPNVERHMVEAVGNNLRRSAVGAALTLTRLSTSARSEYVQLQASDSILDRSGYKPPDRTQVQLAGDIKINIDLS